MVFLYPIFAQEKKGIERHMSKLCKEIGVFVASGDGGPHAEFGSRTLGRGSYLSLRSQMLKCLRKVDPAVSWQSVHLENRSSRENNKHLLFNYYLILIVRTLLIILLFVESPHDYLFY